MQHFISNLIMSVMYGDYWNDKTDFNLVNNLLNSDYILSPTQAKELFDMYTKKYNYTTLKDSLTVSEIVKYRIIGYYNGNIFAFSVSESSIPFVMFEYKNSFYKESKKLIKKSVSKMRGDYKTIVNPLILTTLINCDEFTSWLINT